MGTGAGGACLPHHVGETVGGEGVLQLAGHHGGPSDGVSGVAHAQVIIREDKLGSDAWLKRESKVSQWAYITKLGLL